METEKDKKLNKIVRVGSILNHLFAVMTLNRFGSDKIRRIKMNFKWLTYFIVGMTFYMTWTMFFIISELNAQIFMSLIHKIAKRIALGY